jgi:hypothetical protein
MIEKVESIKRPLKRGELFLVPCITSTEKKYGDVYFDKIYITPVFNLPHNDKQNRQEEIHYHVDYRFVKYEFHLSKTEMRKHSSQVKFMFPFPIRKHRTYFFVESARPVLYPDGSNKLEYIILPVINEMFVGITEPRLVDTDKIKHKCLIRNKCPHRGFDMAQVEPNSKGVRTCPLHGLRFNNEGTLIYK